MVVSLRLLLGCVAVRNGLTRYDVPTLTVRVFKTLDSLELAIWSAQNDQHTTEQSINSMHLASSL